ncbi:MAG: agmatine deiminase family protein [Saprospiraceae bacterium]|nr:agmatine deiminase family protein [Saprospiraceae bacterium]
MLFSGKPKYLYITILWVVLSCTNQILGQSKPSETHYYDPGNANRTAAEWEPAKGTMITWPLCIPYKLVIELSKDNHLYTLVDNEKDKKQAKIWYAKWGIDSAKTTFITAPQGIDVWWTRDWGPSAVFTPEGKLHLGDGKYIYATPESGLECDDTLRFLYTDKNNNIIKTEIEDNATLPIGKTLDIPILDLPFITTGGNVMTDGLGTAFSSCIILNENRYFNVSESRFFKLNDSLSGYKNYHILSNFEQRGIQHIDCLMKLLDEERILVAEPPKDHELYPIYEDIVENELKTLRTIYGRPYEILRLKTGRYRKNLLAAYTNSIIVNKTIYVPLFNIRDDSIALQTWKEVMPGYTIKGFTFVLDEEPVMSEQMKNNYSSGYGWTFGDALHCRTRAIWDPEMLYITVKRLPSEIQSADTPKVYTTIIDYSKKGLVVASPQLFWRIKGDNKWNTQIFQSEGNGIHFNTSFPINTGETTVEYYISASSKSGKTETMPRTAPQGFYSVNIKM